MDIPDTTAGFYCLIKAYIHGPLIIIICMFIVFNIVVIIIITAFANESEIAANAWCNNKASCAIVSCTLYLLLGGDISGSEEEEEEEDDAADDAMMGVGEENPPCVTYWRRKTTMTNGLSNKCYCCFQPPMHQCKRNGHHLRLHGYCNWRTSS